jgi:hypothetical protein
MSVAFHIQNGLRQGHAFLPLLFKLSFRIEKLRKSGGTGNALQLLVFADYVNLWGKT